MLLEGRLRFAFVFFLSHIHSPQDEFTFALGDGDGLFIIIFLPQLNGGLDLRKSFIPFFHFFINTDQVQVRLNM